MSKRLIEVENLKHIKNLSFPIPGAGVWILTGANGSGKSALLACLHRIGFQNAFPQHFPSSETHKRLDGYSGARVSYHADGRSAVYSRQSQRWVPRPKREAKNILGAFGFSEVLLVGADPDRLAPKPEDFNPTRSTESSDYVKDTANYVFSTRKFSNLREVNVTRGVNKAFLIREGSSSPYDYYSEKSMSVGELVVLKLLRRLEQVKSGSLLLIDELEMALHPNAQVALFNHLKALAKEKNLTVVFSTHSASLIKSAGRKSILHVDVDGGRHHVREGCYPSYVLGAVAGAEERGLDLHLLVEDEMAAAFLRAIVDLWGDAEHRHQSQRPKTLISPIGSYERVIKTTRGLAKNDPVRAQTRGVLDKDVEIDVLPKWKESPGERTSQDYFSVEEQIHFLPVTPECSFVVCMETKRVDFDEFLKVELGDRSINTAHFKLNCTSNGWSNRGQAKAALKEFSKSLRDQGVVHDSLEESVIKCCAQTLNSGDKSTYLAWVGKLLT